MLSFGTERRGRTALAALAAVPLIAMLVYLQVGAPHLDHQARAHLEIVRVLVAAGERFRLAVVAEDLWGNPTRIDRPLTIASSRPIENLAAGIAASLHDGPCILDGLAVAEPGDVELRLSDAETGEELGRANPLRAVAVTPLRHYWGDLHGQSGETVGTNPAESYFRYARDKAFIDIVGHQGNDFQITDEFWQELNRLTAAFDEPGRFVCVPGYEWSGNTGMGGDRNVFHRREGRPIHRSSRILVPGQVPQFEDCHTAKDLFRSLASEDAVVIAHVGGRYADIRFAHDGRLERAVEVHSTWGTFEWLLHDAFAQGYRVGVVCHSDDHKGRPGATRPGASTFGAIGGLTCYVMPELTRDALFAAVWPLAYTIYGLTRGAFDGVYPYFFTDPTRLSWPQVLFNMTGLMAAFFVGALALAMLDRTLRPAQARA
mgnify:CR=1 FL=1